MPAHPSLTHPDLLLADFVPRLEKADRIKFWPLSALLLAAYMIETLTGSYQILDVIILYKYTHHFCWNDQNAWTIGLTG